MNLQISIEPKDTARIQLRHPGTNEGLGAFIVAGPDHEATKNFHRGRIDLMQKPGFKFDTDEFEVSLLTARTIGWEGIKSADTGEDVPFDPSALPGLYKQGWLRQQVLVAIGNERLFYRE
jgi:hypothetical protein